MKVLVPAYTEVLVRQGSSGPWTDHFTKLDEVHEHPVAETEKYGIFERRGWQMMVLWSRTRTPESEDLDREFREMFQ